MTHKWRLQPLCSLLLTMAALISIPVFAGGCNTVQPPSQQVSDAGITTKVKTKLAADVRPSSLANIDVNTTNGIVTLAGAVESPEVKQRAEAITASVSGVVRVNDNLQVVPVQSSAVR